MKQNKTHLILLVGLSLLGWSTAYSNHHGNGGAHDHAAHGHSEHAHQTQVDAKPKADHPGNDHAPHAGHDHGEHGHAKTQADPNGGRVITSVDPHIEFFVTDERMVQITFLNEAGEAIAPQEQSLSLIGGDRQNPVRLRFSRKGSVLVSDKALPEGNGLPLILSIKPDAQSRTIRERFNLNLNTCPTCKYKEYACICGHGEGGHDH